MSKTIHIHIHGRTRDADGPAHAPAGSSKGGQFISGGGGGGSSGGASHGRPQHSPMRQANRNLEAQQLKESRKVVKAPQLTNIKSVRREQAESDVAEAKKRIAAHKSSGGASAAPATSGSASKEHTDLVKYHAHVSKNSATSRVSWASVAKEANKALASGKLSPTEHKAATAIHKEASGKANALPKPGVPNVGAYAHLTKK